MAPKQLLPWLLLLLSTSAARAADPTESPTTGVTGMDGTVAPSFDGTYDPTFESDDDSSDTQAPTQEETPEGTATGGCYFDYSADYSGWYDEYSCGDGWAFGSIQGDRCYAVDSSHCVQSTTSTDGNLYEIDAFLMYYNAILNEEGGLDDYVGYGAINIFVSNREGGCCNVEVRDSVCPCTFDGRMVTVESCDSLPEDSPLQFDGLPQSIDIYESNGFEMKSTEEMCQHPSVNGQKGNGQGKGPKAALKTSQPNLRSGAVSELEAVTVKAVLELWFQDASVLELDPQSRTQILLKTKAFFLEVLQKESKAVQSVDLGGFQVTFGDPMTVQASVEIGMDSSASKPSKGDIIDALAESKWVDYIHKLKKDGSSEALQSLEIVKFKGIAEIGADEPEEDKKD